MKCHICGGEMQPISSDMPLKLAKDQIVIFKQLPVLQCGECGEYLIEDFVMERIEKALKRANPTSELEILNYANADA